MRKIVIAGSSSFYKEVLEIKKELESKGYEVINYPKKINVDLEFQNTYESYYESLNVTDDLLLLNLDKKGITGYIGYESFAELSYLVVKKIKEDSNHKIYIYKMPSKEVGCYDEIKEFLKLGYIELYKGKVNESNATYINTARKAIQELIDITSYKKYPSYYEKTTYHKGVIKIYKGAFTKTNNSFIIVPNYSNVFELYDKNILTEDIETSLKNSSTDEEKINIDSVKEIFKNLHKEYTKPIKSFKEEGSYVKAMTDDQNIDIFIPKKFYSLTHKLLGSEVLEYTDDNNMGIYFSSPKGRALIMKRRYNKWR